MPKSLEYLIQLHPDKTGAELLAIQKAEKEQEELEYQESIKEDMKLVEDINKEPRYYKGTFGLNQYYIRKVSDAHFQFGKVTVDVDTIVIFDYSNDPIESNRQNMSIERKRQEERDFDNYGFSEDSRTTEEEWNKINAHLEFTVENFWGKIDPNA
jgi:hypothetical protein